MQRHVFIFNPWQWPRPWIWQPISCMRNIFLLLFLFFLLSCIKFASVAFNLWLRHDLGHALIFEPIAALALGVFPTHLLIMLYLSVKFHQVFLSNFVSYGWDKISDINWTLTLLMPWPWAWEPNSCALHTFPLRFIFLWSFIKFISVVL